jgi:hypothetical protein
MSHINTSSIATRPIAVDFVLFDGKKTQADMARYESRAFSLIRGYRFC